MAQRDNAAPAEIILHVLAGSIEMLAKQLRELPQEDRARIGGPRRRALTSWRGRVLELHAEHKAAREARVAARAAAAAEG